MAAGSIGEQELAVLRFVADAGGASVGQVADEFGATRGLARSTVLTVMERLRRKGHLTRRLVDGVYRYEARASSAELLRNLVRRFVDRTLDGSVAPFVAYLNETSDLSDDELKQLEEVVAKLQSTRRHKKESR